MQTTIEKYLIQRLEAREAAGNKRQLPFIHAGIDFYSNDYLGLAKNNHFSDAEHSSGATGSRLLSGNSEAAVELEAYLARFHQSESALLFNSGYDANLGLISALANRHTTILYDELSHASIIDGARLSYCKQCFRFRHNDITDLASKLEKYSSDLHPAIVVVESVYSMEGDFAPLQAIVLQCKKYNAALVVDEAHATGVFGNKGEGLVQQLQLQKEVFARVHTFGKALGCHGAVVTGSGLLISYLTNFARSFIYTTALPPQANYHIRSGYLQLQNKPQVREKLHDNIDYFNRKKKNIHGFHWKNSVSPIQSLITGSNEQTKKLAQQCKEKDLLVSAILSPTVARGTERLRICLHSFNTKENIDQLFDTLQLCLEK